MQITIINDCCDENAKLRQVSRVTSLIKNSSANCFGVKNELEAAGFLVDAMDAFEGREGAILVNVAPRGGKSKKWENGTPFGYFKHRKTWIFSSVDGLALSLVKKLDIISEFYLVDIPSVMDSINDKALDRRAKERIIKSQFRSFDFLPRLAAWILDNKKIPKEKYNTMNISDTPNCVWFIDNFGNIKTTVLPEEIKFEKGKKTTLKIGGKEYAFNFFDRLKDMPDQSLGLVAGSSGLGEKRFIEILLRGGNAAEKLGIKTNDRIIL